jgi:hypothetical protein
MVAIPVTLQRMNAVNVRRVPAPGVVQVMGLMDFDAVGQVVVRMGSGVCVAHPMTVPVRRVNRVRVKDAPQNGDEEIEH